MLPVITQTNFSFERWHAHFFHFMINDHLLMNYNDYSMFSIAENLNCCGMLCVTFFD